MFFFFTCPSFFSFERHVDVTSRCLLSLLDEAVKQNHASICNTENDPSNPAVWQTTPDFPEFAPERANQRHSKRPRELNVLDVFADHLPVCGFKTLQPLADRLATIVRAVEVCRQALQTGVHGVGYHFWYVWVKVSPSRVGRRAALSVRDSTTPEAVDRAKM